MVEPPTALTIQAGRPGKSLCTRQLPEVVRASFQASWVKLSHSSLMKSWFSMRGPASRITTLTPFCASSLPSVPPPAPEPTITTTPLSFRSNFAMCDSSLSGLREPVDIGEAAFDVSAMLRRGALVTEFRPELFLVVERGDEIATDGLKELGLLDALQQFHAVDFPGHVRIRHFVVVA